MFETTCTECGGTAKVPFKPTPGKPVYCTDCFNKNRSRRDENRQVSVNPRNVWARRRPDGQKEKEREYVPVAFNTLQGFFVIDAPCGVHSYQSNSKYIVQS